MSDMIDMILRIEALGGTPIELACKKACDLALFLDITIEFKFNGVTCLANPGGTPEDLAKSWSIAMESERPHKFASCHA